MFLFLFRIFLLLGLVLLLLLVPIRIMCLIFIIMMSAFFACNEVQVKVPIVKEGEALFENTCGSEYVETLKAHEAFYGDNPPLTLPLSLTTPLSLTQMTPHPCPRP